MTDVPETILRSTCAVLRNDEIVGTAWLVSSDGLLLTAGHLLGVEQHQRSIQIRFPGDIARTAECVRWGVQEGMGIDFAVVKIDRNHVPHDARPIPIALPERVTGEFCLIGYGVTLLDVSTGSGTFAGHTDVQNSMEYRLFLLQSQSCSEEGYSGAAVYSSDLRAVVAIQIETADSDNGTHANTVLAMPLYRVARHFEGLTDLADAELPSNDTDLIDTVSQESIEQAIDRVRRDLRSILQTANQSVLDNKINDLLDKNKREQKSKRISEEIIRQTPLSEDEIVRAEFDFSKAPTEHSFNSHIEELRRWTETVSFRDMKGAKLTHQIYIELNTYVMPLRTHMSESERHSIQPIESAIAETPRHCVVLGQPGAGKTTSMKKLLINYFDPDSPISQYGLPMLIRFRDLSLGEEDEACLGNEIKKLLNFQYSFPRDLSSTAQDIAEQILDAEVSFTMINELRPFIILDGFDEIPTHEQKSRMLKEVRLLANKLTKSKFVLTCRTGEFNYHLENTDTFELSPLSMPQVKDFAGKWINDKDKSDNFVKEIQDSPFADTVIKPLSLAHLCAIYERIGSIPDRPKTVYRKVVALMIEEWDEQRSVIRKSQYSKFEADRKFEFLCHLAYHLTTTNLTVFSQDQLAEAYLVIRSNFGLPKDQSLQTANELESHTGLFIQSGYQKYEFAHKSLQEYLTAEYLVKLPSLERLGRARLESLGAELAIAASISSNPSIYFADIVLGVFNRAGLTPSFYDAFVSRLLLERPDFYPSSEIVLAVVSLLNNKPRDKKLLNLASVMLERSDCTVLSDYFKIPTNFSGDFYRLEKIEEHPEYELPGVMQIPVELFKAGLIDFKKRID